LFENYLQIRRSFIITCWSNGIYKHENIHYQFSKSELDLLKLDYIHVSAGNQDVPIRNLTINHEKVAELHPTFDKDFKLDTSRLIIKTQRLSLHHVGDRTNTVVDIHPPDVTPKPHMKRAASTSDLREKPADPQPPAPAPTPPKKQRGFFWKIKIRRVWYG
jgi:hypothetical protein